MPEAWLLDTNILLRMSREEDPLHATIASVLRKLAASKAKLCFTSQILGEFWNVATRPQEKNGIGLSISQALELTHTIESNFEFLPDSRATHDRWRVLIEMHEVWGSPSA